MTLFRRPADATFVFCGLLAILAGYLIHRWLTGTVPPPRPWQRAVEIAIAVALIVDCHRTGAVVGTLHDAAVPIIIGTGFAVVAIAVLCVARRLAAAARLAAAVLAAFSVADLGWNNAPNESTGLPPSITKRCARTPRTKPSRC